VVIWQSNSAVPSTITARAQADYVVAAPAEGQGDTAAPSRRSFLAAGAGGFGGAGCAPESGCGDRVASIQSLEVVADYVL